jgi:hypothetical protein
MLPRLPRLVAIQAIARRGGDYQQSDVFTVVRGGVEANELQRRARQRCVRWRPQRSRTVRVPGP